MPTCLAFGDSNTHGSMPMAQRSDRRRFDAETRWPGVMAAALGPDWTVVEEGLPGRTTSLDDPVMGAHINGRIGLQIALASHAPIDVLAILLGANDQKTRFAPSPARVAAGLAGLLDMAQAEEIQARHNGFRCLLIAPPRVREVGVLRGEFHGAEARSAEIAALARAEAEARGAAFLDADALISVSPVDGIHYEAEAHRSLGTAVADALRDLPE